ncbi:MAG: hypothetical protein U9N13_07300, partial [Euryarchaeota archaeon]|nr:hypothetical protein [Euryarchaeota archaeon]
DEKFCMECGANLGYTSADSNIIDSVVQHANKGENRYVYSLDKGGSKTMEYSEVHGYLIDIAKNGCNVKYDRLDVYDKKELKKLHDQRILVTYKDVLGKFGYDIKNQGARSKLSKLLDKINENSTQDENPILLSALVVTQKDLIPGDRFYEKWHPQTNGKIDIWWEDLEKIWQRECKDRDILH